MQVDKDFSAFVDAVIERVDTVYANVAYLRAKLAPAASFATMAEHADEDELEYRRRMA